MSTVTERVFNQNKPVLMRMMDKARSNYHLAQDTSDEDYLRAQEEINYSIVDALAAIEEEIDAQAKANTVVMNEISEAFAQKEARRPRLVQVIRPGGGE